MSDWKKIAEEFGVNELNGFVPTLPKGIFCAVVLMTKGISSLREQLVQSKAEVETLKKEYAELQEQALPLIGVNAKLRAALEDSCVCEWGQKAVSDWKTTAVVTKQFTAIRQGRKTAEIRYDDRDYRIGDRLILKEWKPRKKVFTQREIPVRVVGMTRLNHVIGDGNLGTWVVMYFERETE